MSIRSIRPSSSCSTPIGISVATTCWPKACLSDSRLRKKSARSRSSMFTNRMRDRPRSDARSQSRLVVTSTPITPFTTNTAPSQTRRAQSASATKLGSPGVSIKLILRSPQRKELSPAEIDISRDFSSDAESETVVPSATEPSRLTAPAVNRSASFTEVFPLPRWPSKATLRILLGDSCAIDLLPSKARDLQTTAPAPTPGSRERGPRCSRPSAPARGRVETNRAPPGAAPGAAAPAAARGRTRPRSRQSRGTGTPPGRRPGRARRWARRRAAALAHGRSWSCRPRHSAPRRPCRRGAPPRSGRACSRGARAPQSPSHPHHRATRLGRDLHLVHQALDDRQAAAAVGATALAPVPAIAHRGDQLVRVEARLDVEGRVARPVRVLDRVTCRLADGEGDLVPLGLVGAGRVEEACEPAAQPLQGLRLRRQREADRLARHRARPHGEQRHVIARTALADHACQHRVAEALEPAFGAIGGIGQGLEALLERLVAALHQTVGVEEQRGVPTERGARLAEHAEIDCAD